MFYIEMKIANYLLTVSFGESAENQGILTLLAAIKSNNFHSRLYMDRWIFIANQI